MKTTFSGGVGEEQTPVRHQDTPDHHEGVRNIQEHRDEARNVCSSQNDTTGPLPPPPKLWKNHPLLNRKQKTLPSLATPTSKKPTVKKKTKLNMKIENKQKKENDIRRYYRTENDRVVFTN